MPRTPGFAVAALLPILSGCVTDKFGNQKLSLYDWSVEEELQMGQEYSPSIESQFDGVYADAETHQYLEGLIVEMAGHSIRKDDFRFTFQVLDSDIPNAFALPGGFVYITRGLLSQLETEGQFISVMGHELGHVEHQHAMFQQTRATMAGIAQAGVGLLGGVLAESSDNPEYVAMGTALAQAVPGLVVLSYSRDQELESDQRGIYFAAKMGYNPLDGVKTFELFERMEAASGGGGELSLFRTHPLNQDRIRDIQATVRREHPTALTADPATFRTGGAKFQQILTRLQQRAPAYEKYHEARKLMAEAAEKPASLAQAERLLQAAHSAVPTEPLFEIGLGEIEWHRKKFGAARSHFDSALALYQGFDANHSHWKVHFYAGLLDLDAKRLSEAEKQLTKAMQRFPVHPEPRYYLGKAFEMDNKPGEAQQAYESVLALTADDSTLHLRARERLQALGALPAAGTGAQPAADAEAAATGKARPVGPKPTRR